MRAAERLGRLYEWAMDQDVSDKQRVVLMHLIRSGDRHLVSFWSHAKIAQAIGSSTRAVGDAVRALEEKKLIRRRQRKRNDNTRSTDVLTVAAPPSLLVIRQNQAELAATPHEGWDDSVYGLIKGSAEIAERAAEPEAGFAEHNLPIPIEREVSEGSARQKLPRRSRSERASSTPRRLASVIEQVAA